MSLFSPIFRSVDQEIAVLERRLELRRGLMKGREAALHDQVVNTLTSPRAFACAAALGFVLGRNPSGSARGASRRKGALGWLGGVGLALLQMRYGSPYLWIARAMAGVARRR